MQLNRQVFMPQTLSKYLASVGTACTSRCKDRDSVIILRLGVLGDKDRGGTNYALHLKITSSGKFQAYYKAFPYFH